MDFDLVRAAVLGVVQGIAEFLPISSSGHLLLVRHMFDWPDEGLSFDAWLHFGTVCSILVIFRHHWKRMAVAFVRRHKDGAGDRMLFWYIVAATIPAAVAGVFLAGPVSDALRGREMMAVGFGITATLLFAAEIRMRFMKRVSNTVRLPHALAMGGMQILALLPGVSRSGSTITSGMFGGLSRIRAVEFSFLLSLPITAGAGGKVLLDGMGGGTEIGAGMLVTGFLFSFLSGCVAMRFLLKYLATHTLLPFALYVSVLVALFAFGVW